MRRCIARRLAVIECRYRVDKFERLCQGDLRFVKAGDLYEQSVTAKQSKHGLCGRKSYLPLLTSLSCKRCSSEILLLVELESKIRFVSPASCTLSPLSISTAIVENCSKCNSLSARFDCDQSLHSPAVVFDGTKLSFAEPHRIKEECTAATARASMPILEPW